ncbi:MAG: transcription/translation regulatory transformer protein RfaH [Halioglobus sp.]
MPQLWYTIQTKPRQEALAEENLLRQNYSTYLPRLRLKKRRRNQWREVIAPLFPRYLFIRVDADEQSLAPIRSTLGVTGLVRFGQLLRPVPDEVIGYLKQAENQQTHLHEDTRSPHRLGDEVEILEGPFAGLQAVYQMDKPEQRALLLIELLGRRNQVIVGLDNINVP